MVPHCNQLASSPVQGAKLKCRLCTRRIRFSDDRRHSARWRYWLAPRCCISRQAAASFTSTRRVQTQRVIFARHCICRPWQRRRSISSAHLSLLPGIHRSRCTRPRAIRLPCIAPGAPLPPRNSISNSIVPTPVRRRLSRLSRNRHSSRRFLSTLITDNPLGDGEKMLKRLSICLIFVLGFVLLLTAESAKAQLGNSGSIEGVVKDASGGVVAGATVEISYAVSGFRRETTTGSDGSFKFTNVPLNTYHLLVAAGGFANYTHDVDLRSGVPVTLQIGLKIGTAATSVTVEAKDLVENESTFHTDIDRGLFERLPLESASSSVSSLVTLASPGAIADSNGLVHAIGDHAETSFSVDNQPITDQTSKVFSNQIPVDSIQSLEVISGAPPAEFGDKTSLVIKVTTRSGLGQTK